MNLPYYHKSSLAILLAATTIACGKGTDDTGTTNETGLTGTTQQFEEGCILVDGAGGYKWLDDALSLASDGSVITLCEGEILGSVELTGALTIEGPGADLLLWTADVNHPAISISGGADITLTGFEIASTRHGIEVADSTGVSIEAITFADIEGTGVKVADSTGVVIDNCSFVQPDYDSSSSTTSTYSDTGSTDDTGSTSDTGNTTDTGGTAMSDSPIGYGGVEISAGEVTVSNSEFIQVIGFAIHATDYASVTATMNEISYVTYGEADSSGNVSDGFALWAESGSTLTTNGNTLQYNFLGIMADQADIVLSNDYIGNGLYGIFGLQGDMYIDNLLVENNYVWGILLAGSGDDYSISNTQVIGDPELVATGEYLDGSSIGIQMQTSGGEISDTTVTGYNYIGINLTPYDSTIDVTMTNVDVDEAGTFGIMASQGDYTLNNVSVTNHRTPYDPYSEDGSSIQSGFATSFWYANTTWIGGGVSDSEFIGSLVAWSSLSMDGTLISGNASRGIWNYESTVVLAGCTVSDSSPDGGINAIYADTTIDGCAFSDNNATDYWEYESSDGSNYGYLYYYRSTDIISQSASRLEVTNNTFTNGSRSIQTYSDANVLIKDNNWTNYNTDVMAFYSSADTALVEDNVITESGGGMIYANSGDVEISNLSITDTRNVISTTTYFQDGVETSTSESEYSSDLFTAYYSTIYISDLTVTESPDHVLYFYDTELELYDSSFLNTSETGYSGYAALYLTWSGIAPSFSASNVEIDNVEVGPAVLLQGYSSGLAGDISIDNFRVMNSETYGIALYGLEASSLSMNDVMTDANGLSGVLFSGTNGELSNLQSTGNGYYGMECASATFDICEGLTLNDNGWGEEDGCADACAELANTGDTGDSGDTGDTGM